MTLKVVCEILSRVSGVTGVDWSGVTLKVVCEILSRVNGVAEWIGVV